MKKLIIAIVMGFMALTMNGQSTHYFSNIYTMDEFGQMENTAINGRIYISDSTIVIKTPKGVYDILEIQYIAQGGTKDKPIEASGKFMYGTVYFCTDHNKKACRFAHLIEVTQYSHTYVDTTYSLFRLDDNEEIIQSIVFGK